MLLPSRGIEPYDQPNTIYIERHEPFGFSTVFRSTDFFQSRENQEVILEEVRDFQLRDKYMFATKVVVSGGCSTVRCPGWFLCWVWHPPGHDISWMIYFR